MFPLGYVKIKNLISIITRVGGLIMYIDLFNESYLTESNVKEFISSLDDFEDCLWIKNLQGQYIFVNTMLCNILQKDKKTLLTSNDTEIFDPNSLEYIKISDLNVIKSRKKSVTNEHLYIKNKEIFIHTHKIPILDSKGNCNSFLAIGRIIDDNEPCYNNLIADINESMSYNLILENENITEDLVYKEINEYVSDLYDYLDISGISIWFYDSSNELLTKKTALGIAQYILDNMQIPLSVDEANSFMEGLKVKNLSVPLNSYEYLYKDTKYYDKYLTFLKDHYITFLPIVYDSKLLGILNLYHSVPFYNKDNSTYIERYSQRIALSLKNISLSKELTSQLQKKVKLENELNILLNISTDLCAIIDTKGYIKKISSNLPEILGWTLKDLNDIPITNIIADTDTSVSLTEIIHNCNKKFCGGICKLKCKNGDLKSIKWYYYHEVNSPEIFLSGKDVTSSTKLQNKVVSLESKVQSELLKTEFLANVSHEFKTPLNIILSAVQLELDNFHNNKAMLNTKYLDMIKQNSYRLLRLVNNLIDSTEIDGNSIKPNNENVNFIYYIEEIVDSVSSYINNIDRTIIFDTDEEEVYLTCDLEKIERILLNLISNAIKYTEPNGTISVTLNTDWNKNRVYVSVKDDGVGIPKDKYDTIFNRFKQVDDIFVRRSEGSGLGLPLAKTLVEFHGGELYVNKNVQKGSEFIFYIPITEVDENPNPSSFNRAINSRVERFNVEFSDIYSIHKESK